jgi:hypothetical protein
VKSKKSKWPTEMYPILSNTQTLRFQHVTKTFQSNDVPSFVLPVIRNLKRLQTMFLKAICLGKIHGSKWPTETYWQDLQDDDMTCMQSSYWELILENGQWLGCWITDRLCALPAGWTGIHGFGNFSLLIGIVPFSAHKLINQDTAVLHQAIIV